MNKSCETFWLFKKVIMRDIHANTHLSLKKIKVVGTYVKSVLVFSRDVAQETCLLNFLSRILRLWRNFWRKLVWETDEVFGVSSRRFPLADRHQCMLIITFCNTSVALNCIYLAILKLVFGCERSIPASKVTDRFDMRPPPTSPFSIAAGSNLSPLLLQTIANRNI